MPGDLTSEENRKQELYRDARFKGQYDEIWQSVDKCVFCDLREKYIFFEENGVVMTIILFAYIDGHFMIVPRRHVASAKELSKTEWDTVRKFTYIAKKIIKKVHSVEGMQLVQKDGSAAQSTVNHLHFHCIPFDAPDLCQWNYRQLSRTPLENVQLYKQARKDIIKSSTKFDDKYADDAVLPIVCDLILVNSQKEILFQQRKPGMRLDPDYLTPPGGRVESTERSLEEELAREVEEEINYKLPIDNIRLVSSRITNVTRKNMSPHLRASYRGKSKFLLNTYLLRGFDKEDALEPGDDCESIHWIPVDDIVAHERISEQTKSTIASLEL